MWSRSLSAWPGFCLYLWPITRKLFEFLQFPTWTHWGFYCSQALGFMASLLYSSHRQDLCSELSCLAKHILIWSTAVPQCSRSLRTGCSATVFCNVQGSLRIGIIEPSCLYISFTVCKAHGPWFPLFDGFSPGIILLIILNFETHKSLVLGEFYESIWSLRIRHS